MKVEFLKDENGNIWFFFASNIQVRSSKARQNPLYDVRAAMGQKANQQKEQLIKEIQVYENEQAA